ncbi:aldose 1-epimerase [Thalassotalea sp. HSM 43]|uniref:aldose 1-epimerase n=1 Tax=Thalassotalea sp. HSM 43 TaxID=2552945 RepID=UPI001081923A|nr:aldose 1-epimerase [Thalassotalea sp. HSM 43]QBY04231.1 aldose 1-epimerase [Thalassotalea sp. HSM 43]
MEYITIADNKSKVVICPDLGASVVEYRCKVADKTIDVFPCTLSANEVTEASCFPLVPFSNRIRDGRFNWQGQTVQLPLNQHGEKHTNHGHGWQSNWQVISKTRNKVELDFNYHQAPWPFPYRSVYTFELQDGALLQTLTIKNVGHELMPAGLGLHPYFSRTQQCYLRADVDKMWHVDEESMPVSITDAPACINDQQGMVIDKHVLDNTFTGFSGVAEVNWPEWQAKAVISTSDNCEFLVVYSPEQQPFFCAEPVTHSTDAINLSQQGVKGTGFKTLAPEQEMQVWMKISPQAA